MRKGRRVLRFCLWILLAVVGLVAALVGYSVYSYSSAPAVHLAGTLTKGSLAVDGLTRTYRTYVTTETTVADGVRVEQVLWRDDRGVEVELVAIHGGGHGIPQPYRRRPRAS